MKTDQIFDIQVAQVENWFTYHAPAPFQVAAYERIRQAGRELALVILEETPIVADQTAAIRKVREAVMTANAAIACEPPIETKPVPESDIPW
jgi:hypothetical protein